MSESNERPPARIKVGRRVICRKQGPFNGKRGRVQDRIGEAVMVDFDGNTIIEKATYFEPV